MTAAERELYRDSICQFYDKSGHIAKICWWLPKRTDQNHELPQALAALTLDTSVIDTEWTSDTGASNHMTGQQGMLTHLNKYNGTDSIVIGDGSSLPITGIGNSIIKQKNNVLPLHDVLFVPNLKKNLLSVSQLTSQYPVNCEFSNVNFCVKERNTGRPLITGRRKGNLYVLSDEPEAHFSYRFKSGTTNIWHQRLGYPQFSTIPLLKNKGFIDVIGSFKVDHL